MIASPLLARLCHDLTECSTGANLLLHNEVLECNGADMERLIKNGAESKDDGTSENKRRRQILDAARKLFARRGFHGVSVRTIAAEAGLKSPAHLYFYFENKAALYRETLAEMTAPVQQINVSEAALDRSPARALGSIARAYLRMFDDEDTVQLYRSLINVGLIKETLVVQKWGFEVPLYSVTTMGMITA